MSEEEKRAFTPRYLDVLDLAWTFRLKEWSEGGKVISKTELAIDFYVNIAENGDRKPWGSLSALTTGPRMASNACFPGGSGISKDV